jgi:Ca2+:H+ antiporter
MLVLAAIALILPAYFQSAAGTTTTQGLDRLSVSILIVLLLVYLLNLAFALVTHRALFAGSYEPDEGKARPSKARVISVLAGTTVGIAWRCPTSGRAGGRARPGASSLKSHKRSFGHL